MSTPVTTPIPMVDRILRQIEGGAQPLPLSADEVDQLLLEFEQRETEAEAGMARVKAAKEAVIAVVQAHGVVVPQATESIRILGRRNQATVTTAKTTTLEESAVDELGTYCAEHRLDGIFEQIFSTEVRHRLIEGARKVLGGLKVAKRHHDKIEQIFGRCFTVTPKAPALKVAVIKPEKPARAKREKAAA